MYVLSFVLKVSMEGEHFIKNGRLFQSFGAATAKAQSPLPTSLDRGTVENSFSEDLRVNLQISPVFDRKPAQGC